MAVLNGHKDTVQLLAGLGAEMNKTETTPEDRCVRGRGRWTRRGAEELTLRP